MHVYNGKRGQRRAVRNGIQVVLKALKVTRNARIRTLKTSFPDLDSNFEQGHADIAVRGRMDSGNNSYQFARYKHVYDYILQGNRRKTCPPNLSSAPRTLRSSHSQHGRTQLLKVRALEINLRRETRPERALQLVYDNVHAVLVQQCLCECRGHGGVCDGQPDVDHGGDQAVVHQRVGVPEVCEVVARPHCKLKPPLMSKGTSTKKNIQQEKEIERRLIRR